MARAALIEGSCYRSARQAGDAGAFRPSFAARGRQRRQALLRFRQRAGSGTRIRPGFSSSAKLSSCRRSHESSASSAAPATR